ncbi:DUF2267 domain-containing protein [Nocardia pseudovaccinii]|uniref:DUF2267 domain-containing protein n=1 Tax=Nocardia pseudovaccinii TaxID=189540 RepID=UPI003D8C255C
MNRGGDPFAHTEQTARIWLDTVMECLGTSDRRYAYRVLRAWLHTVRDRLTVDAAAHLGAQLPELLRGIYYEGWRPSDVPKRYDQSEFVQLFAAEATISDGDVPFTVTCLSAALRDRFSPGTLEHALEQLPPTLRELLLSPETAPPKTARHGTADRLDRLERSVESLSDTLARIDQRLAGMSSDQAGKYEAVY